jgi:hypothetical protein
MKLHSRTGAALIVVALAFGLPAKAEEPEFDVNLKVRGGVQMETLKDHLGVGLLGFGFEFGWNADAVNRWTAEAGYIYKPGSQYLLDVRTQPVAQGMTVDPASSVDSRKNSVQGITLRLAYERAFQGWSFKAGLMMSRIQFRQEYIGDVADADGTYDDTYNGVVENSAFHLSPFAGVRIPTLTGQSLEATVLLMGYTAADYVHVAGAPGVTSLDHVTTSKRTIPHLELAYSFQF